MKDPNNKSSTSFVFRRTIFILIPLALVALLSYLPFVIITQSKNGEFLASAYTMQENNFRHPRLIQLRKQEKLDQVVAKANTEFEKIIRLRHWAHEQWKSDPSFYYPPWDAVEILDLARHHNNHGFCAQYAIVFLQACQAMGIHARYVDLPGHFVAAIWSDDFNKWVIMDPTHDVHYELNGVPISGGNLCKAYWTGDTHGLLAVQSDGTHRAVTKEDLKVYRMYSIVPLVNQLETPIVVQVNDQPARPLIHQDDFHNYPLVGRDKIQLSISAIAWDQPGAEEKFQGRAHTDDPDNFRYVFNQSQIFIARKNPSKGLVKIALLSENAPTLKNFEVNYDGLGWQNVERDDFSWSLHSGTNLIEARVVTQDGWRGPIASMKIFYKPGLFNKST